MFFPQINQMNNQFNPVQHYQDKIKKLEEELMQKDQEIYQLKFQLDQGVFN